MRIRAPGIFYARHSGFATGRAISWTRLENQTLPLGDLGPQQLASAVLWVEPGYDLADVCIQPLAGTGCFTADELIVSADNASGDVRFTLFEPPASVAPTVETIWQVEDVSRWNPLEVILLIVFVATLTLIIGIQIGRRADKLRNDPPNGET